MPEQSSQSISMSRNWLRMLFVGVFFSVLYGISCPAQYTSRVLVTAPREYQRALDLAQRDLDNQEYANAIERIESLLHGDGQDGLKEDFFVGSANSARFAASLRSRAERMLFNLPPKARELYELQFGAEARLALDTAIKEFDTTQLARVRRRYAATESGLVASMILGRHYLNTQRPMAALLCFQQLNDSQVARQKFGTELPLLLAMAARRAGQTETARSVLVQLKQDAPNLSYDVAGTRIDLFESDDDALAWLDNLIGTPADSISIPVAEWLTHRGNNQRNAEAIGSMPLLNVLWEVEVTTNPLDTSFIRELREQSRDRNSPLIPSIQPLVTADTAFIRGPQRLVAVDVKTGKRIWDFSWQRTSIGIASAQSESNRRAQIKYRLLDDAVYGRLASDGELLFLVGKPKLNEDNFQSIPQNAMQVQFGQFPLADNQSNLLVALDIASEGKYEWKVGGRTGEQEPKLSGVFFLGPPIVVDDELYVIGDRNNEISLFALDRATGRLRWTQQLAHSDPRARYSYFNQRRRAGAIPSYANGVLVCPTSSGAVIAVDIASRSLLWGYQYPILLNQSRRSAIGSVATSGNWLDSSVTIADDKVILTPIESGDMHCLNLANGESVWKRPVKRAGKLFVAAARKGILSVVSNHFVHGLDLETGEQKWTLKLDARKYNQGTSNLPTGFGFRSGDHYFLPTVDSILEFNAVSGELVKTLNCDEPLGTIVPYHDQIVSLGLDFMRKYHQSDRLAETVSARLKESPDDAWALEQNGALLFEAGKISAGMTALRKAIESYPEDAPERDRAKRLFVSVGLVALESDFAGNLKLAAEIEKWIERPQDRQEFLLLRANGMLSANKPRQAFESLRELVFASRSAVDHYATFTKNEKTQYTVRQDRSIRTGIKSVLQNVSESETTALLATLRDGCDRLISEGDVSRIRAAIRELGDLPVADSLRLFVAEQIAADQPVVAEILLLPVIDSDVPELAAEAHCLTAAIYANSDYHRAAARCFSIARANWPEAKLKSGQTVSELCNSFSPTSSVGRYIRTGPKWQYGATTFAQVAKPLTNRRPSLLVGLIQQKALTPHAPKLDFWHDGNSFVATDRLGRERNRIPAPMRLSSASTRPTTSRQLGSVSFVNFGNVVVAVDNLHPIDLTKITRQGPRPILWPTDYSSQMSRNLIRTSDIAKKRVWKHEIPFPQNRKIHGIATASVNGLAYLTGNQLICVDPLSGEELWSRSDIAPKSRVWGDDHHVLVEVKNGPAARIFDIVDGHEIAQVDIPTSERRWSTIGRDIVAWENGTIGDEATTRVLYLFDPLTQTKKWSRECNYSGPTTDENGETYSSDGAGFIADDQFACILEPDGRCMIIDLETGELLSEDRFELPSDKNLTGINLIVTDEQFTVVVHFQLKSDFDFIYKKPNVATSVRDGIIQSYSRKTGKPQWANKVEIDRFGLFDRQPRDVPVLLFARNANPKANRNVRPNADIIGIDRRDGRRLFALERQPIPSSEYRIQANAEQSVDFRFPNSQQFRLQFSDEPVAPAPPLPVSIDRLPSDASEAKRAGTNRNGNPTKRIERSPFELEDQ